MAQQKASEQPKTNLVVYATIRVFYREPPSMVNGEPTSFWKRGGGADAEGADFEEFTGMCCTTQLIGEGVVVLRIIEPSNSGGKVITIPWEDVKRLETVASVIEQIIES